MNTVDRKVERITVVGIVIFIVMFFIVFVAMVNEDSKQFRANCEQLLQDYNIDLGHTVVIKGLTKPMVVIDRKCTDNTNSPTYTLLTEQGTFIKLQGDLLQKWN
jgi:hypothetical protein